MNVVLLSTFNGQEFIAEQLASLINQKSVDCVVYIRDDQSSDETRNIIENYQRKHASKLLTVNDNKGNLGVSASFRELLVKTQGDYFFYCDQDDIWNERKIAILTRKIKEMESIYGQETPILVFSDLILIDDHDKEICSSFVKLTRYKLRKANNILFRGFIPGCSMAFNNATRKKVLEYKNYMGFTFLIASLFGKIGYVDEPLIKYRIHQGNTVGLGKSQKKLVLVKDLIKYIWQSKKYRDIILKAYYKQAKELRTKDNQKSLINAEVYLEEEINNLGFFKRKKWYLNHFTPFSRGWFDGMIKMLLI